MCLHGRLQHPADEHSCMVADGSNVCMEQLGPLWQGTRPAEGILSQIQSCVWVREVAAKLVFHGMHAVCCECGMGMLFK